MCTLSRQTLFNDLTAHASTMCKKPPHFARLMGYEIHNIQTCTSCTYTSSWGCYIGGGGKEVEREWGWGKEEARREREQEVVKVGTVAWLYIPLVLCMLQFWVWGLWLRKKRLLHHRHRSVLWADRHSSITSHASTQCTSPCQLVGYEIHHVQTCTSASTYAYTSSWGCYIGGGGKGAQREGGREVRKGGSKKRKGTRGGQGRWD